MNQSRPLRLKNKKQGENIMQNNNIEYLRKSIKKLSRFNYFSMIINLIISCLLVLNTILAFMEVIEFEIFLIIFLFLEIFYYLSKLKRIQLIEKIDATFIELSFFLVLLFLYLFVFL